MNQDLKRGVYLILALIVLGAGIEIGLVLGMALEHAKWVNNANIKPKPCIAEFSPANKASTKKPMCIKPAAGQDGCIYTRCCMPRIMPR